MMRSAASRRQGTFSTDDSKNPATQPGTGAPQSVKNGRMIRERDWFPYVVAAAAAIAVAVGFWFFAMWLGG